MNKLIRNNFTYSTFLDYVERTPRLQTNWDSSETGSSFLSGTSTLKEALDLAKYGWDSWIKQLQDLDFINVTWTLKTELDIVWATVDIARYVNGQPDCMINFIDEIEREKPQLTMYIPLSYAGRIGQQEAQRYLLKALEYIVQKNQTYDTKVYWVFDTNVNWVDDVSVVTLKDFGQQIVLNNFAFAFHPSFFRRIWFKYLETQEHWNYGYWKTVDNLVNKLIKSWTSIYWETQFFPTITGNSFSESSIIIKSS